MLATSPDSDHPRRLSIAVGIATRGRPAVLHAAVRAVTMQSRAPDRLLVAATTRSDLGDVELGDVACTFIHTEPGLTLQRNAILRAAFDQDVVVFLDDDFLASSSYVEAVEQLFLAEQDVALATGFVIADGIVGPGLSVNDGVVRLRWDEMQGTTCTTITPSYNVYGCNFAVRTAIVRSAEVRFDESLPLYGWLEDVDFSRSLADRGRIVRSSALRGVHLGVKLGRQSGFRLGYSQIANPVYLVRKGTYSLSRAVWQMSRNIGMNLCRSVSPEPYVDRRGRLRGNVLACWDFVSGRLHPKRVLGL